MSRHWLIIDASFIAWRAFYGIGRRESLPSILMALSEVERLAERFGTNDHIFAFDHKPYLRKTVYKGYKQSRDTKKVDDEDEQALVGMRCEIDKLYTKYLDEMHYQNVYSAVGYEADDIIAAVVAGLAEDDQATIISADQDLYQLLNHRVSVFHPTTSEMYTIGRFREENFIHPLEWAEAKAIAGCSTDDIPGVDGVGIKTACKYIFGDKISKVRKELIEKFVQSDWFPRNMKLTTLPFEGLERIVPKPDGDRPHDAFLKLCRKLDMEGIANDHSEREWRKQDGQDE